MAEKLTEAEKDKVLQWRAKPEYLTKAELNELLQFFKEYRELRANRPLTPDAEIFGPDEGEEQEFEQIVFYEWAYKYTSKNKYSEYVEKMFELKEKHEAVLNKLFFIMLNSGYIDASRQEKASKFFLENLYTINLDEITDEEIKELYTIGQKEKARETKAKAEEKGAIMTLNGHLASFSQDILKDAFTTDKIFSLPSTQDAAQVFDNDGKLNLLAVDPDKLEKLKTLYTAFFMALTQFTAYAESQKITFNIAAFCKEGRIDPRGGLKKREITDNESLSELRLKAVMAIINQFDKYVGMSPNGSFYRVLSFDSYDATSETITINVPYIFYLQQIATNNSPQPQINSLFHSSVLNEPNAAVELANRIICGVLNRGTRPDCYTYKTKTMQPKKRTSKTVTEKDGVKTTKTTIEEFPEVPTTQSASPKVSYMVKYSTLIEECPILRDELNAIENEKDEKKSKYKAQTYNSKLKNTFKNAYRIITEKTDVTSKYKKFTLPKTFPTKSTLNAKFIITHEGKA